MTCAAGDRKMSLSSSPSSFTPFVVLDMDDSPPQPPSALLLALMLLLTLPDTAVVSVNDRRDAFAVSRPPRPIVDALPRGERGETDDLAIATTCLRREEAGEFDDGESLAPCAIFVVVALSRFCC